MASRTAAARVMASAAGLAVFEEGLMTDDDAKSACGDKYEWPPVPPGTRNL
jgi:hypothetical protein